MRPIETTAPYVQYERQNGKNCTLCVFRRQGRHDDDRQAVHGNCPISLDDSARPSNVSLPSSRGFDERVSSSLLSSSSSSSSPPRFLFRVFFHVNRTRAVRPDAHHCLTFGYCDGLVGRFREEIAAEIDTNVAAIDSEQLLVFRSFT